MLISTDKAVAPTSVMGATKRVAEQICLALNAEGPTRYVAVRFGNVLGSRGSVVPIFQQRIRRGEPITVRGPEMRRYFMATSEAVLLVLQAGAMGAGGEIFALDMGEPIRVIDLAKELIRLSGLEPERDVPIVFADPEPGEKEHEDMLTAEEGTAATRHDRVFVVPGAVAAGTDALFPAGGRTRAVRGRGGHRGHRPHPAGAGADVSSVGADAAPRECCLSRCRNRSARSRGGRERTRRDTVMS